MLRAMRVSAEILIGALLAGGAVAQTNAPAPYMSPSRTTTVTVPTVVRPNTITPSSPYDLLPAKKSKRTAVGTTPRERITARVLYVDAGGSDQNDGAKATPLRSIQKAADIAGAGDVVLVQGGVYAGFRVRRSGVHGFPISFVGRGDARVESGDVLVQKAGWVSIEELVFRQGVRVTDSHDVVIRNNLLCGSGGIDVVGELATANLIVNNTVIEASGVPLRFAAGASRNVAFNNLLISPQPIADETGHNLIESHSNLQRKTSDGIFIEAGDFHLGRNSPALHAGCAAYADKHAPDRDIEGIRRYTRAPCIGAYDIGPFEPPRAAK
jgi:hypothetical protein